MPHAMVETAHGMDFTFVVYFTVKGGLRPYRLLQ